jgi:hypothetical protein
MRLGDVLLQQAATLRKIVKEQDEFYKKFETRQDKAIKNWTNNGQQ